MWHSQWSEKSWRGEESREDHLKPGPQPKLTMGVVHHLVDFFDPPWGGVSTWWAFPEVESGPRQLPGEGLEMELPIPFLLHWRSKDECQRLG